MGLSQETRDYIARQAEYLRQTDDWTELDREFKRRRRIETLVLLILSLILAGAMVIIALSTARADEGSRPLQCPHKYCGCALSLKLFGRVIPKLNLAANWPRTFPRASAAPGRVAARRGHVMLLVAHVRGKKWLVYDPNSGQGRTREHVRSIAGFTIVNPHARMAAQ